jgi:hypothetical protein
MVVRYEGFRINKKAAGYRACAVSYQANSADGFFIDVLVITAVRYIGKNKQQKQRNQAVF